MQNPIPPPETVRLQTLAIEAPLTGQRPRCQSAVRGQIEQTLWLGGTRHHRIAADAPGMIYPSARRVDDLILHDLQSRELFGDEVVRRPQDDTRTRNIPAVVVCANVTSNQPGRLLAPGVQAHWIKPPKTAELMHAIEGKLADQISASPFVS